MDLFLAIPNLYQAAKIPIAASLLIVGSIVTVTRLKKGAGAAIGTLLGTVGVTALAFNADLLANVLTTTVDAHTGGIFTPVFIP
jgi:hypothetical protein